MAKVTDPALLAQLNETTPTDQSSNKVTDPKLLAQLNSPDVEPVAAPVAKPKPAPEAKPEERYMPGLFGASTPEDKAKQQKQEEEARTHMQQSGEALGLNMDQMYQAVRQYTAGMFSEDQKQKSIKTAAENEKKLDKLPARAQMEGGALAMSLPIGPVAGEAATAAKAVSTGEKIIQGLKTLGMGGAMSAGLTPATDSKDSFAGQKAWQFGEGVLATGALSALPVAAQTLMNQFKKVTDPEQRAAIVQKLADKFGFSPEDLTKLSNKAKTTVDMTERGTQIPFNRTTKPPEQLGEQVRQPLVSEEKRLIQERKEATDHLAEEARQNKNPISTQHIIDFLREKARNQTTEGKALYAEIAKELQGKPKVPTGDVLANLPKDQLTEVLRMSPAEQNQFLRTGGKKIGTEGIPNAKFENVRNFLDNLKQRKINGQTVDQVHSQTIDQVKQMLEESASQTEPKWGEFLDTYKEKSKPLDAFRRQEGKQIGKVTEFDPLSQQHEMPGEKVVDHLIEGGPTRVRAAMTASKGDPQVKNAIEQRLWQQLQQKGSNNKLTASSMDTFMQTHGDVMKELGVHDKFDAARNQLRASEAIEKTAVGKIAKSAGNSADTFETLGKILNAGEGQRLSGLKELVALTEKDKPARDALRYSVVMHMVTESPTTAQVSRAAILPDLEKSGLFSVQDMKNIKEITDKFDQMTKIGINEHPTTVLEKIIKTSMNMAEHIPVVGKAVTAGRGAVQQATAAQIQQARRIATMAAIDPESARVLLSTPTPENVKVGLSAMQRAGIYATVNQAMK